MCWSVHYNKQLVFSNQVATPEGSIVEEEKWSMGEITEGYRGHSFAQRISLTSAIKGGFQGLESQIGPTSDNRTNSGTASLFSKPQAATWYHFSGMTARTFIQVWRTDGSCSPSDKWYGSLVGLMNDPVSCCALLYAVLIPVRVYP